MSLRVHRVECRNFHDLEISKQRFAVLLLDAVMVKQDIDHGLIIEPRWPIHALLPCAMPHMRKEHDAIPTARPNLHIFVLVILPSEAGSCQFLIRWQLPVNVFGRVG